MRFKLRTNCQDLNKTGDGRLAVTVEISVYLHVRARSLALRPLHTYSMRMCVCVFQCV